MSAIVANDTDGLSTHGNDLAAKIGSTSVADNVSFSREGRPERRTGFKNYSANLPDFAPTQLLASANGSTAYLHLDNGIWYHDGTNWLRKKAVFGQLNAGAFGLFLSGSTLYMSDSSKHVIWTIDLTTGARTVLAGRFGVSGTANGTGDAARFNTPSGIWVSSGTVYVADRGNHSIRKITSAGVVTTLAGTNGASGDVDSATAANVRFDQPYGVWGLGTTLYVADGNNLKIKATTLASGATSALATVLSAPRGITSDGTDLYAALTGGEVAKITTGGTYTQLVAGAPLSSPSAIYWDSTSSRLLVADSGNYKIFKVTTAGTATAFIGSGLINLIDGAANLSSPCYDGGTSIGLASIDTVNGIAADADEIYFNQAGSYRGLRKVYRDLEYVATLSGTSLSYATGTSPAASIDGIIVGPSE